jgi:hypothetical protein
MKDGQGSDSNNDHWAFENHNQRLAVGQTTSKPALQLTDPIYRTYKDTNCGDSQHCSNTLERQSIYSFIQRLTSRKCLKHKGVPQ